MNPTVQAAIARYRQAHERMYGQPPHDLRVVTHDSILLNGLVVSADDLEQLAAQILHDYAKEHERRPSGLRRAWDWLNQ